MAKSLYGQLSYDKCAEIVQRKRRGSVKLTHNTYLERDGAEYVVRLWGTDILRFLPDGSVVLNSGGYRTVTTKDRLNHFGPVHVHSVRGRWYAGDALFQDGMTVEMHLPRAAQRIIAQTPLTPDTPLPIVADWCEENGREEDAAFLRVAYL